MCLITVFFTIHITIIILHAFLSCASRIALYISMFFSASCFSISFRRVSLCPPLGLFDCLRPSAYMAKYSETHELYDYPQSDISILFYQYYGI